MTATKHTPGGGHRLVEPVEGSTVDGSVVDGPSVSGSAVDGSVALRAGQRGVGLLAQRQRLEAEAIVELVCFEQADLTAFLGYSNIVRYLEVESGVSRGDAVRVAGLVRHCRLFSLTAASLRAGVLTVAFLEVLASTADGLRPEYERDERELLGLVEGRDVATFTRALANWRHRQLAEMSADDAGRAHERRGLTIQRSFDGSGFGRFNLDAVGTDILEAALETRPDPTASIAPPRSLKQRRADTLIEMADCYLNGGPPAESGDEPAGSVRGTKTTVDVIVDLETLEQREPTAVASIRAELASGSAIPLSVIDQLVCDASYRRLIMDGPSTVLDYGTAVPDIPVALRRAVQRRDGCCQFAGCDRRWQWCDVHHLIPRANAGPTNERNLALVCRFHHTLIHVHGWTLKRDPTTGQINTRSP